MKKLIGIFAILLLGTAVFGQKFIRDYSHIEVREEFLSGKFDALTLAERMIKLNVTDHNWIDYVHFVMDDRVYLLSYEIVDNINKMDLDRQIYLYSKDINDNTSSWEPASKAVLTCGFMDIKNYTDVDFYREDRSKGSVGTVNVLDDCVEMTIGVYRKQAGSIVFDGKLKITFTPSPISTNFYLYEKCYI